MWILTLHSQFLSLAFNSICGRRSLWQILVVGHRLGYELDVLDERGAPAVAVAGRLRPGNSRSML